MNSTAKEPTATPSSVRLERWRDEIQMFYERTRIELNRISASLNEYKASSVSATVYGEPPRDTGTWRETPQPPQTASESEAYASPPSDGMRSVTPGSDSSPADSAQRISAERDSVAWARPETPRAPVSARPLEKPAASREADSASCDRLTLLKQQIAAKLSASPRDDKPSEEPR